MNTSTWTLEQIVDLERYPITDLESPAGGSLVDTCRSRFKDGVLCELEAFLRAGRVCGEERVAHCSRKPESATGFLAVDRVEVRHVDPVRDDVGLFVQEPAQEL